MEIFVHLEFDPKTPETSIIISHISLKHHILVIDWNSHCMTIENDLDSSGNLNIYNKWHRYINCHNISPENDIPEILKNNGGLWQYILTFFLEWNIYIYESYGQNAQRSHCWQNVALSEVCMQ